MQAMKVCTFAIARPALTLRLEQSRARARARPENGESFVEVQIPVL